ncbi:GNAT family N-acetyltransferase [Chryseomicrobium excrementi]|uniref:GNAT family N-acetyltransferase n=1 Tax=Chryseomicrobium excrementi TaxID=2041346 RepID=A0A2M9EY69_9BACL|nr:GNAT family N-acetyltransferase [Chryseomicrobium excrementi]PJK16155.1 GNAT family N-acetyltransferase [Chryseomicrobium excrementi]
MNYQTHINDITADQLQDFFDGWPNPPSAETHIKLIQGSSHVVVATDPETRRVVGFITAVSDGVLSAYIPFLEVIPSYKGQGIGTELVKRMFAELRHLYMIDLACDDDLVAYYEKFGMIRGNSMVFRNYDRQSGE